jgi:hypothetical protein
MRNMLLLQTCGKLLSFFLNFLKSQLDVKMQLCNVEGLKLTVMIFALQFASWQYSSFKMQRNQLLQFLHCFAHVETYCVFI